MKALNVLAFAFVLAIFSLGAPANEIGSPIQITCGNTHTGNAVEFSISPLQKSLAYKTMMDGIVSSSQAFGPSKGIYDQGSLDFSGGGFLDDRITIHGQYARYLRINHFSAITINFVKAMNADGYTLQSFSSGYEVTSEFKEAAEEHPHAEYIGLSCTIIGY